MRSFLQWNSWKVVTVIVLGLIILGVEARIWAQNEPPPPPMPPGAAQVTGSQSTEVEVLTRGPVHEAFATPVVSRSREDEPPLVVPKEPPAPVAEVPAEFKPDDDEAIWIPGYWAWDDERKDFLWVSGIWRIPPPGMRWVPGYWSNTDEGFEWVAGFWMNAEVAEVSYYPNPPAPRETEPISAAPSDDYFWVPGYWNYVSGGYRWVPGFWSPYREHWVWCPNRYTLTPAGWIFVPGYWDYTLASRGQIFAPVYFRSPIYVRRGFYYTPQYVLDPARIVIHLWIRPSHCHYYFGNYYGSTYAGWNLQPWHMVGRRTIYYDPLFVHQRVHYRRQGVDFAARMEAWHTFFVDHAEARPAVTLREQVKLQSRAPAPGAAKTPEAEAAKVNVLATSVTEVAKSADLEVPLVRLSTKEQQVEVERTREIRDMHQERVKLEKSDAARVAVKPDLPKEVEGKPGKVTPQARPPIKLRLPQTVATRPERPTAREGTRERPPRTKAPEAPREGEPRPEKDIPKLKERPKLERPPVAPGERPKVEVPAAPRESEPRPEKEIPKLKERPKTERPAVPPDERPKIETPKLPREPRPKTPREEKPGRPKVETPREPIPEPPKTKPREPKVEPPTEPKAEPPQEPREPRKGPKSKEPKKPETKPPEEPKEKAPEEQPKSGN